MFPISDVDYVIKAHASMLPSPRGAAHGRGTRLAPGPGDKTGLRLSPHLAPSTPAALKLGSAKLGSANHSAAAGSAAAPAALGYAQPAQLHTVKFGYRL